MKYNIGDFIFFFDAVSKKVATTGTVFDIRKNPHQGIDFIYKIYHQETGLIYEYPEWHLNRHTKSSKEYEASYGI